MPILSDHLLSIKKNSRKPAQPSVPVDMRRVAAIVLGGGRGTRLFPLTNVRCKPAINFGGTHRLIDITLSNAIHSFCEKIYIITQYLSTSLHKHIANTYQGPSISSQGFVEILSAEQKPSDHNWYQGTADAVRQNLYHLAEAPVDYFLILSGDQIYDMDFRDMIAFANATQAEVVISTIPIKTEDAKRFGVLKIDTKQQITQFIEKPQQKEILDTFKLNNAAKKRLNLKDPKLTHLASMGIYLFRRDILLDILKDDLREDFGKHILPKAIEKGNVYSFIHKGYWEDIGNIKSFYETNIALTYPNPPFDCHNEARPLIRSQSILPGARIDNTIIRNCYICEGSRIEAEEITHSIIGPRSVIKKGTVIHHSYVMGNDFYTPPMVNDRFPEKLQISEDCIIQKAIIDKDVYIGKGVRLINKQNLEHYDSDNVYIRDGIIIVPRGATIHDGFII